MTFKDKWEAFDWMYKKQLGRRNLTAEQRQRLIGQMYEARKQSYGASDGFRGNQHTELVSHQNEDLPKQTAQKIAEEVGVSKATVERAAKFSKGIDAMEEISKEAVDKAASG